MSPGASSKPAPARERGHVDAHARRNNVLITLAPLPAVPQEPRAALRHAVTCYLIDISVRDGRAAGDGVRRGLRRHVGGGRGRSACVIEHASRGDATRVISPPGDGLGVVMPEVRRTWGSFFFQ